MRKSKFVILCAGLFLLADVNCSSFSFRDKKEGLVDNVFRAYVRIDTLDIPEEMTDQQLDEKLLLTCSERLKKLWTSMCAAPALAEDKNMASMADSILKTGKLSYRRERDEYAEAYADYTLDKDTAAKIKNAYPEPVTEEKEDDE